MTTSSNQPAHLTTEPSVDKHAELRASKQLALSFFIGAAALFVMTLFLSPGWWVDLIKAFSEAAMIGALADWFAVVALFKRIPIPFVSRHTEIIPKNKEKIADNLALFVRDRFLDTESIVALIRRHDPARAVGDWLVKPENTARFGGYLIKLAAGILDFIEDTAVQNFIRKAVHALIGTVDLSKSASSVLETLTANGRHQELLNEGIGQLAKLLHSEETQATIAQGITDWLKEDYAMFEKMLPTEVLGRKGADVAVRLASGMLARIDADPAHPLRASFDIYIADFIERLKSDPAMLEKGEEFKRYLMDDPTLNDYLQSIWTDIKAWLKADLHSEHSVLHQRVSAAGQWVGQTLADDPALRDSLNLQMEIAARSAAPGFAAFLTTHIADTVKQWDSREMSEQIELNIGKDLQYIRINGTIVGGLVGVVLYLLSHLPPMFG